MYEIPKPQTLDPDRPLRKRGTQFTEDDRPESELLRRALRESCAYAEQMWDALNAQRAYLLASLPPDPRSPGIGAEKCASPTGPDDEAGWARWISAFSATTSVLCGPKGDSGFGLSRARKEAQIRRSAPETALAPNEPAPRSGAPGSYVGNQQDPAAAHGPEPDGRASAAGALRAGVTVGVALLAVRGLLPRRRPHAPAAKQ